MENRRSNKKRKPMTPQRRPDRLWSLSAILIVAAVGFLLNSFIQLGVKQLDADASRAGQNLLAAGSVKGAAVVEQVATFAVTGGGVDRAYTFDLVGRTTAYDLLTRASLKDAFSVDVKQYDFGVFIEGVEGVKGDATKFWAFYVNGSQANVGADSYVVQPGDMIEFRLEAIQ